MKELTELMLTMDDVSQVLWTQQIAGVIEKYAQARMVGRQLCRINRDLMGKPGNQILIPKDVELDATSVSEGASQTLQTPSYDSVTCKVQIWGTAIEIGDETLECANFDILKDQIASIGYAIAKKEDKDIVKELIDWTDVATEASAVATGSITTVTLAYGNVIEVSEILISGATATTTYTIDYKNGVIHFESAPDSGASIDVTYAYNASVTTIESTTAGVLNLDTVINAINNVEAAEYTPDAIIVHPDQMMDLRKDSAFQDASKFGNSEMIVNGRVGKFYGLEVFMTTQCPKGVAIVFDRTKAMMLVIKKDIWTRVTREGSYAVKGTVAVMGKLWSAVCRVNDGAICMITAAQDDAELGPL